MAIDRTSVLKENQDIDLAWDQWFKTVYPKVYYTIFRKTAGVPEITEDLVQESIERFIRYNGLDKVQTDSESVSYLVRTGVNLLNDQWRKEQDSVPFDDVLYLNNDLQKNEEMTIDLDRITELVNEDERNLIGWLREGRSVQELADRLNISYSAAGVRIFRLMDKLKKIVNPV